MDVTYINQWLIDFVAAYPAEYDQINIWRPPILACAPVDDRFNRLREITVTNYQKYQSLSGAIILYAVT